MKKQGQSSKRSQNVSCALHAKDTPSDLADARNAKSCTVRSARFLQANANLRRVSQGWSSSSLILNRSTSRSLISESSSRICKWSILVINRATKLTRKTRMILEKFSPGSKCSRIKKKTANLSDIANSVIFYLKLLNFSMPTSKLIAYT